MTYEKINETHLYSGLHYFAQGTLFLENTRLFIPVVAVSTFDTRYRAELEIP